MKRFFLSLYFFVFLALPNVAHGESLMGAVLTEAPLSNINSCIIYRPILGITKEGESLKVNSDKFELTDDEKLILKGNVELDFPDGLLRSREANLDRKNGEIRFSGRADIFLDKYYFNAQNGYFNKEDKSISLAKGQTYLSERNLIFNFEQLDGNLDNLINLQGASITSCAEPDKGWILEAKNIELDSEKQRGLAKGVKVKVMGSTIFAFPYIPFTTSEVRTSGFLEPSVSYSSDGIDFSIPYFAVLSDHSDITLGVRNIAERGSGIEVNYRYIKKNTKNNFDAFYFSDDKEMQRNFLGPKDSRWAFKLQDSLMLNKTSIIIDWAEVSDAMVLRDIPGEITSIGSQRAQNLNQSISIRTELKNTVISLEHQEYQALNPILTNGYRKSPALDIRYAKQIGSYFLTERLNVSTFKADTIHGYFGYQDANDQYIRLIRNPAEGSRIYSDFSLSKNTYFKGFNIKTNLGLKSISYNLNNNNFKTKDVNAPNLLIDVSTLYIKNEGNKTSILQPRITFGYTPFKDQENNPIFDSDELSMNNQLFSNDRFSGMDRIGDQKFYTLNLKYKKFDENIQKLELSISKKYFFEDRRVSIRSRSNLLDRSMTFDKGPLNLMAKWIPNTNTKLVAYAGYSNQNNKVQVGGITLKQEMKIGSFGYAKRFRRSSGDFNIQMNYSELFANISINSNYKFIARLKRDTETNKNIESVVGFEYENCCFALRLTGSDKNLSKYVMHKEKIYYPNLADAWDNIIQIENKSRINFEFELKGFNSSFKKVNRLLNNSLLNY